MALPRTIAFYVMREVLLYTLLGLVAVSFVFIGHNLVRRLADFLMVGVDPADIFVIVRSVLLVTLAYTVPIAFLFGALVGVARLAADGEITAMRACGIGLRDMVFRSSCSVCWSPASPGTSRSTSSTVPSAPSGTPSSP